MGQVALGSSKPQTEGSRAIAHGHKPHPSLTSLQARRETIGIVFDSIRSQLAIQRLLCTKQILHVISGLSWAIG